MTTALFIITEQVKPHRNYPDIVICLLYMCQPDIHHELADNNIIYNLFCLSLQGDTHVQ